MACVDSGCRAEKGRAGPGHDSQVAPGKAGLCPQAVPFFPGGTRLAGPSQLQVRLAGPGWANRNGRASDIDLFCYKVMLIMSKHISHITYHIMLIMFLY